MSPARANKQWSQADPADYERLDLHAHTLLADVPLHDVWQVELPGGPPDCTLALVRPYMSFEALQNINPVVRLLFAVRGWAGRIFGWDGPEMDPSEQGDSDEFDGPFRMIHQSDSEAIGEIENATVHAFSVMALERRAGGYRFYWGIYVRPVGRIIIPARVN